MINQIKDIIKRNLPSSVLKDLIKAQSNFIHFKELIWLFIFKIDKRPAYINIHSQYKSIKDKANTKLKQSNQGKEKVIYINEWNHQVGIVDRLNGILTSYYLAKKNKRPFYIVWHQPFELTQYLEPA